MSTYRDTYPPYHSCVDCEIRYSPLTMHKVMHKEQVRYRCAGCHQKRETKRIEETEQALKAWYSNKTFSWGGKGNAP